MYIQYNIIEVGGGPEYVFSVLHHLRSQTTANYYLIFLSVLRSEQLRVFACKVVRKFKFVYLLCIFNLF